MIYIIPTDTCFWISCPISEIKDYLWIYKIKKRSLDKPLAILISDFKWLKNNTDLNWEQIKFLKKNKKPFTILANSDHLKMWINYIDKTNNLEFINKNIYKKFAFRIANNNIQKKLIEQNWPMFLTSANLSNKPEIYNYKEIENQFGYHLDKKNILFIWKDISNNKKNNPSDIFEFKWDSLNVNYLRKNN